MVHNPDMLFQTAIPYAPAMGHSARSARTIILGTHNRGITQVLPDLVLTVLPQVITTAVFAETPNTELVQIKTTHPENGWVVFVMGTARASTARI
jgi:hypothetical protein